MARRSQRLIGVAPSADASVVALVLYWAKQTEGEDVVLTNEGDNQSPHVDISPLPALKDVNGEQLHVISLEEIPELQNLEEGTYDFGAAYKDSAGNISDIVEAEDVTLDITPPEAPSKVVVISTP